MCGRYSLYESMDHYLKQLALELVVIDGYDDAQIGRFNVAPRSAVEVIHPVPGGVAVNRLRWGWAPHWARSKGPVPINARAETVTEGRFFSSLWPGGRALAPANGWFEWTTDPHDAKRKQPWYIHAADGAPLFFAALADPGTPAPDADDGFVIVTAAADEGLLDVHDRKPLVLTPALAREWLDPQTTPARAEQILRDGCRPASAFRWHKVGKAVGNVRNDDPRLIEPVPEDEPGLF